MKNCILKGLCVFFMLLSLLLTVFIPVSNAQSGHGGTTEVIARIEPEETQPSLPTEPEYGSGKLMLIAVRPASAAQKEQSYVYAVSGPEHTALNAAIVLGSGETSGYVIISHIPEGEYTVIEENAWSWRYSDGGEKTTVVADQTVQLTFEHTLDNFEWLDGYSHRFFQ